MQLNHVIWNLKTKVYLRTFAIAIITSGQKDSFKSLAKLFPKSSKKKNTIFFFIPIFEISFLKFSKIQNLFLIVNLIKKESFKI